MTTKSTQVRGLSAAREVYRNRSKRASELRGQGKMVMGYFCSFVPLEMMTAAGIVPYRIFGNVREPITLADTYIEKLLCSYIRSCLDMGLKGAYDHLDGIVLPNSCDNIERIDRVWWHCLKPKYIRAIEVPHWMHGAPTHEFFKAELGIFRKSLEEFTGREISNSGLKEAVRLHNENRALVRELYILRKPDPPLISGTEVTEVMIASMSLPVEESNDLLRGVISDVKRRRDGPSKKSARLLIWGSCIDDTAFMEIVEQSGANIVMDDLCVGSRHSWHDVELTPDPMDGIVARYLEKIPCPVICWDWAGSHRASIEKRFGHLKDYVKEYNVNGAILYYLMRCDNHAFCIPDLRDYLEEMGLQVLCIEDDYSLTTMGRYRTMVQALVETISAR